MKRGARRSDFREIEGGGVDLVVLFNFSTFFFEIGPTKINNFKQCFNFFLKRTACLFFRFKIS